MSLCIFLLLLAALLGVSQGGKHPLSFRVYKGTTATQGQFPWEAALLIDGFPTSTYFCSGSLISANWVLTASHCTRAHENDQITVHLGLISLKDLTKGVAVKVSQVIEHSDYKEATNDIAVLKLATSVQFGSNIRPVALEPSTDYDGTNLEVLVAGFGQVSDSASNGLLNYIVQYTISNSYCGGGRRASTVCAQTNNSAGTCPGDSGAPLLRNYPNNPVQIGLLIGVLNQSCQSGAPDVYTRISSFRNWIYDNTGV